MGCVCCSLSSFVSIFLDALERATLCTVCAMLTCCLLFTIIMVLVLGIGIGFHYCFVQTSVDAMAKAAKAAGALRAGPPQKGNIMRSVDRVVRKGFKPRIGRERRESEGEPPLVNGDTDISSLNETQTSSNLTQVSSNSSLFQREFKQANAFLFRNFSSNATNMTVF